MQHRTVCRRGLLVIGLAVTFLQPVSAETSRISVGAGLRSDDFRWNIAGDSSGNNPNILSELTWRDLEMIELKASGETVLNGGVVYGGSVSYAFAYDGTVQDSDYFGDNRTLEFSRSLSDADDSSANAYGIYIGYAWSPGSQAPGTGFAIIPMAGYAARNLNLKLRNGVQIIDTLFGFTGPFPGLNSSYDAEWSGPWAGVRLETVWGKGSRAFVEFQHHWSDYDAQANWNLRSDFAHPVSFVHETDAEGDIAIIGVQIMGDQNSGWELTLRREEWDSDPGLDRVFFANGTIGETRLNEVIWTSTALQLSWKRAF